MWSLLEKLRLWLTKVAGQNGELDRSAGMADGFHDHAVSRGFGNDLQQATAA
jgi:hypothetical protein